MADLRYQILRLLDERENAGNASNPTIGEIAAALAMPLDEVAMVLISAEEKALVAIRRSGGAEVKDYTVVLKSPAFVYLESYQPSEADR